MEIVRHPLATATTPVTICPLGDIQWAGDTADLAYDSLKKHIKACLREKNPYFVGTGDYIDFLSPSNRARLNGANLYDNAIKVIDDAAMRLVNQAFIDFLKPTKGKWLGLTEGHHWEKTDKGEHSDDVLSKMLGARFLQELGIILLRWPGGGRVGILVAHGKGSSAFPWGPLIQLNRIMPHFDLDIFICGHQTKKAVGEVDRLKFPDDRDVEHRTIKLVGAGGWTKGYISGRRTYISEKLLPPVALGQPIIRIRPEWRKTSTGRKVWEPNISVEA